MSHAQRCAILSGSARDTTMSKWNFLTTELASLTHAGSRTMVSAKLFHASVLAQAVHVGLLGVYDWCAGKARTTRTAQGA